MGKGQSKTQGDIIYSNIKQQLEKRSEEKINKNNNELKVNRTSLFKINLITTEPNTGREKKEKNYNYINSNVVSLPSINKFSPKMPKSSKHLSVKLELINKNKEEDIGFSTERIKHNFGTDKKLPEIKISSNNLISSGNLTLNKSKFLKNSPKELSDFEMIKVIGRGTFGKVILVKSKIDGSLIALKCLKKGHIVKTGNLENIKNEKTIIEKLENPFIIKLKFTFQNKEKIFMGFDYHNGGEIFYHLQKMKRFTEEMAKFYLAELYIALRYLHINGVLYRDLKPENLILDKDGHLKLIDFGLAKRDIYPDTSASTFCGTNEYIPPEVLEGCKYSHNFDWWGFGILMYEMLYGRPPFTDENKASLYKKILTTEPDYGYKYICVSTDGINLMKLLLKKDYRKRIKPEDIPNHPFFQGINFNDIRDLKVKPSFKPKVRNTEDVSNIDPIFLRESIESPVKGYRVDLSQSKIYFF